MSKVYLLKEEDFEALKTALEIDPSIKRPNMVDEKERRAFAEALRFYWYQVHHWMDKVKS